MPTGEPQALMCPLSSRVTRVSSVRGSWTRGWEEERRQMELTPLHCFPDPLSMGPQKALETIGANLQKQYENWQPRVRVLCFLLSFLQGDFRSLV